MALNSPEDVERKTGGQKVPYWGSARKARERKKRATARHVLWLVGLLQSVKSHHTFQSSTAGEQPQNIQDGSGSRRTSDEVVPVAKPKADLEDMVAMEVDDAANEDNETPAVKELKGSTDTEVLNANLENVPGDLGGWRSRHEPRQ